MPPTASAPAQRPMSHRAFSPRGLAAPLRALGALLGGLALAACSEAPAPAAAPDAAPPVVQGNQLRYAPGNPQLQRFGVQPAKPAASLAVELPARLVWDEERTQRVYAAFAGRVSAIRADVGQAVKPGSVLATLASPEFGQAQADTAKAGVDLQLSQKTLQRQRELFNDGIIARKELEVAEAEAAKARADVAQASARTRLYGGSGSIDQRLALTSGIAGIVVARNINPGQELRPDQSGADAPPLFIVSDPTSLWVQIDAREADVGTLRPGAGFRLTVPTLPGQVFQGTVTAAADFIDPNSRTIKIRGKVPNADRQLKAEMLGTVRFERALGAGGVAVPASAVMLRGTKHIVFVQRQEGVFEPQEVEIANEGPREVIVSRGLQAGDPVVTDNTLLLLNQLRSAQEDAPRPGAPAAGAGAGTDAKAAR
ncbi:MAG: efflux RND transporter periplasmic adaptor subunit [Xylophilus ampelinus]